MAFILQEDGSSHILLEDGVSSLDAESSGGLSGVINGQSTFSGAVSKSSGSSFKSVTGAAISGASSVSGSISKAGVGKSILGTISSLSAVSGSIAVPGRAPINGAITASSSLAGSILITPTHYRTFASGPKDHIVLALGTQIGVFGNGTLIAVVRPNFTIQQSIFSAGNASTAEWDLQIKSTKFNASINNQSQAGSGETNFTTNDWFVAGMTKASGTTAPRIHRKDLTLNDTWFHANGNNPLADSGVPATQAAIGIWVDNLSFPFAGDIYCIAYWNTVLTDAQIESITGIDALEALLPNCLWILNQASTATAVVDRQGSGANQTSISGTTVSSGVIPNFQTATFFNEGINAVSSISGAVSKAKVAAGQVTAQSTVSGQIIRKTGTISAVINAISSITGKVWRNIILGTISARSSVTLVGLRRPRFLTGIITGQSTVSSLLGRVRKITALINAISTISGVVGKLRRVSGVVQASSVVSAALGAIREVLGAIVGASSVSGELTRPSRPVSGQITGQSLVFTGNIITLRRIAGVISASSSIVFVIHIGRRIQPAQIIGQSSLIGFVAREGFMGGNLIAVSSINGVIVVERIIFGQIIVISAFSGHGGSIKPLAIGVIDNTSSIFGMMVITRVLNGQIQSTSMLLGSMVAKRGIYGGLLTALSSMIGSLVVVRGTMQGEIDATSEITGLIYRYTSILGQILTTSFVSGEPLTMQEIAGSFNAQSEITALWFIYRQIIGNLIALSSVSAEVVIWVPIDTGFNPSPLLSAKTPTTLVSA